MDLEEYDEALLKAVHEAPPCNKHKDYQEAVRLLGWLCCDDCARSVSGEVCAVLLKALVRK